MRYVPLLLGVFLTTPVSAAVLISEIAWMGSSENTAHEWIELHNTSEHTVDLNQWKIEAQDGTPTIVLQGDIGAGVYFLIKRSAQTLPEHEGYIPPAFGALGNTGEVLFLKNASGEIIDTVEGIPWPAGDNTTKETMQRNGNEWVTALATPGNPTVVTPSSSAVSPVVSAPITTTAQKTVAPTIRIVGAREATLFTPYQFHVLVTGTSGEQTVVYGVEVYLGDGTQRNVTSLSTQEHIYEFPGTYVLTARYHLWGRDPLITRHILTVREPRLSYTVRTGNREAFVIKNESPYELSLHRFTLHNEHRYYTFPFGAVLLANGEMIVSNKVLNFDLAAPVIVAYANGEVYSAQEDDHTTHDNPEVIPSSAEIITPIISSSVKPVVRKQQPIEEIQEETISQVIEEQELDPQETKNISPFVFLTIGGVLVFSLFQRLLHHQPSSHEEV